MAMTAKTWSLNGLATELKMDRRSLSRILEGCTYTAETHGKRSERRYAMVDVIRYLTRTAAARLDLNQERARLAKAQADAEELRVRQRRGELVDASHVRDTAFAGARVARDRIMALPDRLAPILAAEDDEHKTFTILAAECRQTCAELAAAWDVPETAQGALQ
jgi:hypothetical protein